MLIKPFKNHLYLYNYVNNYVSPKNLLNFSLFFFSIQVMRDDDEATLQDYCLDKIASVLMCKDDIEKLSIPEKLRERLKVYIYP